MLSPLRSALIGAAVFIATGPAAADPCPRDCPARPLIVGHRGFAWNHVGNPYPENTVMSAAAAVEAGAEGLEIDVVKTADDVIVLAHDDRLETRIPGGATRTNCRGRITQSTWPDIEHCIARSSMRRGHTTRLDRLERLLALDGVRLLVLDVKNDKPQIDPERTVEVIAEQLDAFGARSRTVLMLYTYPLLEHAHRLGLRTCLKRHHRSGMRDDDIADETAFAGAWGQCASSSLIGYSLMAALQQRGRQQITYLLGHRFDPRRLEDTLRRYIDYGVYGVITDHVGDARGMRDALLGFPPE